MRKLKYIGGEWAEATQFSELLSPYNGDLLAEIPQLTEKEIDQAIDAAYEAFKLTSQLPTHKRAEILENVVAILKRRANEAAEIIALECSKPIKYARQEVDRTIETYKFAAEEAKRISGETIPLDASKYGEGRIAFTTREPIGVIGAITPFNFPMNLVAHKVGPAIASGNTVVLKPASQTALSAYFLAEVLEEAGLIKGAFNIVTGKASLIGNKLTKSEKVSMITFTGSPRVGMELRQQAGLKKVVLELGSNAALIIDEGVDIQKIVSRCVQGAFSNQGQVCISLQRIFVHSSVFDKFLEAFVSETTKLKIGHPLEEDTDIAAMISINDVSRIKEWITEANDSGAKVIHEASHTDRIIAPTIVVNGRTEIKIFREEAFAPIVLVNKMEDIEQGIALVNESRFGLQAGVYTNDINRALNAAKRLEVGGVIINDIPTFRVDHMPYGGVKESGVGREGIKYSIQEMTESKLVVINQN